MSDVLYIQIDKNLKVNTPTVHLGDIAQLYCRDKKTMDLCSQLGVYEIPRNEPGRYVLSAVDVIAQIQQYMPKLEITHIGEPVFILTYEQQRSQNLVWRWLKIALISITVFFGAGMSIMTFNADVNTSALFSDLYHQVTGEVSDGFTELEFMYSLGIGVGVIFFFNHFGRKKLTQDPTPIQVQMRIYEDDVDAAVMEHLNRRKGKES